VSGKSRKAKRGSGGKAGSTNIPSRFKGEKPLDDENGREFALRLLGPACEKGVGTEFSILKKYGDRHFERTRRAKKK
jgi:hypothetical protein